MPLHEPDSEDPMELVGVRLPADSEESLRMMAECFVEEFARLGYDQEMILELFRNPQYGASHNAWLRFGDAWVRDLAETYCRAFGTWRERTGTFEV